MGNLIEIKRKHQRVVWIYKKLILPGTSLFGVKGMIRTVMS